MKQNNRKKLLPFLVLDDFAFRKGTNYGTLICDLRTHQPIKLLPARDTNTVQSWLMKQPNLYIVARDGSLSYRQAISTTSAEIIQVADRFHLLKNLYESMKNALGRILPAHWQPLLGNTIELSKQSIIQELPLTKKEQQKWELIQTIQRLYQEGYSGRQLAKQFQLSRNTVKKYLQATAPLRYRSHGRQRIQLTDYREFLQTQILQGHNATSIFKALQKQGYKGSYSSVTRWIRMNKNNQVQQVRISRKRIIPFFWRPLWKLSDKERQDLNQILYDFPQTQPLYAFVQQFREIYRECDSSDLHRLIHQYEGTKIKEITTFLTSIRQDLRAVIASIHYTYNTSIIEGQINKLKMIKRMLYGRASIQLLEKRMLYRP